MNLQNNDWTAIREHYARVMPAILGESENEWGIDPYAWDGQGIYLTPIERMLWCDIRSADIVMYPQLPVDRFFVDFGNPVARVAIECDGKAYHQDVAKDIRRDRRLEELGWRVYRITGGDCYKEFDEERMCSSVARQFIDDIWQRHAIRRGHD